MGLSVFEEKIGRLERLLNLSPPYRGEHAAVYSMLTRMGAIEHALQQEYSSGFFRRRSNTKTPPLNLKLKQVARSMNENIMKAFRYSDRSPTLPDLPKSSFSTTTQTSLSLEPLTLACGKA